MEQWASYAERGREALLAGDVATLNKLINANFDLRTTIYQISEGNLEMIRRSRAVGASSNFTGSGGAIVGIYEDEKMFSNLQKTMEEVGVRVIRPIV
jgi:glucuronokinase